MSSDLQKRLIYFALVVVAGLIFLAPTLSRETFKDVNWISKPLSLGLDLSGGVHLVYEVQTKEAVKSYLQTTLNALRAELREEKIAVTKAKVNERNQIEFVLFSERFADRAQQKVQEEFKELMSVEKTVEDGRLKFVYGIAPTRAERIEEESVNQAVETLRERVDQFGVSEPVIQRAGTNRIMLQVPGVSDIEAVKKIVGSVAKLEFRLTALPGSQTSTVTLKTRSGESVLVEDETLMTGDAVANASVDFIDGQVEVLLKLSSEGRRTFGRITSENVGRSLAIILDNTVYSAPVIKQAITGGSATISGGFTLEEARQLKIVLRAGALPAPLKVMEERTVGPTLGAESIRNGILAIGLGFALIVVFMIVYYRKAGLVAVGSLGLNLFLIVAALSAFGATLTLPGLAGLALTVGMAVDSNVIIFERIKDELRNGATRDAAVGGGFHKALSAILDSNLTTLLSAIILYIFGSGPVRGFAVTLAVGIVTTVYCATYVSRLAFDLFPLRGPKELSI